jgi:hypothetical protein
MRVEGRRSNPRRTRGTLLHTGASGPAARVGACASSAPYPIEPEALERLEEAGASTGLLFAIRQMLEGRESLGLGREGMD